MAIGVSADKDGGRVSERVRGYAIFRADPRYLNQDVGDSILVGIEDAVIVLVMPNISLDRGRPDFFKIEVGGRRSAQRDADPSQHIFIARCIVLDAA